MLNRIAASQLARSSILKKPTEEKTLVVVTADHGESLVSPKKHHGIFFTKHAFVFHNLLRFSPRGLNTRVRIIDVFPTILDLKNKTAKVSVTLCEYLEGQQGGSLKILLRSSFYVFPCALLLLEVFTLRISNILTPASCTL